MKSRVLGFFRDKTAQGMSEYALIIALVAIAAIASLTIFGNYLFKNYLDSVNRLTP